MLSEFAGDTVMNRIVNNRRGCPYRMIRIVQLNGYSPNKHVFKELKIM